MSEGLFDGVLARGPVREAVGDAAWVRGMLDAEAALATAGAAVGLVPPSAAEAIRTGCRDLEVDVAALGRDATDAGNPVVPLVRLLERAVGEDAGAHVHRGATSQDVLDTAMMPVARRALELIPADVSSCAAAAASLATTHRDTVVIGRTLLQQALPTTFGAKAAGWCLALDGTASRLDAVRATLPAQLGGAVGTLSTAGPEALAMVDAYAAELGLVAPDLPWHTLRLPIGDLAGALGTSAGVLAKVALDVVLLAQSEIAEVAEGTPDRGGSSTLPHKRNPVAAVSARAAARRAPGLVATLLSAMEQEHERAAGAWHAEWRPLSDLLTTVGSAASWLVDVLEHLIIDSVRMRDNLAAAGPGLAGEAVAGALARHLGRSAAHDLVSVASRAPVGLRAALQEHPSVRAVLSDAQLDALLDPTSYVGHAPSLVDRALERRIGAQQEESR